MPEVHFGVIESNKVYSTKTLAMMLGYKQARTLEQKLREREIPMDYWGHGVMMVSGQAIQLAVERLSEPRESTKETMKRRGKA